MGHGKARRGTVDVDKGTGPAEGPARSEETAHHAEAGRDFAARCELNSSRGMRPRSQRALQVTDEFLRARELEIVSAVVAGYSNKEIAEYFKISGDTVKHHLSISSISSEFQPVWNWPCSQSTSHFRLRAWPRNGKPICGDRGRLLVAS